LYLYVGFTYLLSALAYPGFILLVAWIAWLLHLVSVEGMIGAGVFGRLMRVTYIPYVYYPYAVETYLPPPQCLHFLPVRLNPDSLWLGSAEPINGCRFVHDFRYL
jgi:hypothetical protein